jgi:hypothetical protein
MRYRANAARVFRNFNLYQCLSTAAIFTWTTNAYLVRKGVQIISESISLYTPQMSKADISLLASTSFLLSVDALSSLILPLAFSHYHLPISISYTLSLSLFFLFRDLETYKIYKLFNS